jgi:CelD/BcsL family acetyltransferase involved in cellulose biosynthesis
VASHLFVGAGRQANYWLGGHDRAYDDWKPGLLTLAVAAADAGGRGFERLDLGPGPQEYKLRLADTKALLSWAAVVPGGRRSALPYVWLAAERGSRLVRGTAIRRGGRAAGPPRAPASPASRD